MNAFVAYHGVDSNAHQSRVDELAPQGYRPVSLNVSGDPDDARYAAVWLQEPNAGWWAVHGLNAEQYQARFTELTGQGFVPTIVSATGPADRAIFAAVFEAGVSGGWYARHGLRWDPGTDPDTITHEMNRAFDRGYRPRSVAVYGTPEDRRYAGIWSENTDHIAWSWWSTTAEVYQRYFDALVGAGMRPLTLSVASDGLIVSAWCDNQIGQWWARHQITAEEYQRDFDTRVAEGMRPVLVQAGGSGDDTRYAAVFAGNDIPIPRQFSVTGSPLVAANELDVAVQAFMAKYGIRAGTVAVARDANLLASRGYTWAEPGYPITNPDTRFRIASVSKVFAAAAASELVARKLLSWDTPAFAAAGISSALPSSVSADPAMTTITVRELVLRLSHLPRDFDTDMRGIASKLGTTAVPIAASDLLGYLFGLQLVASIPADGLYSNTAFHLLTSVIEHTTGKFFVDVLTADVLSAFGISDVTAANTAAGARQPGEVASYDNPGIGPSQLDYTATALAPNTYGASFVLEQRAGIGAGGLVTSAPTIARVIGRYPVWNDAASAKLTGRELATRYGTFDGTSSGAWSRADGLDASFLFNRRVSDTEHDEIRDAINAFLNNHGSSL